MLIDEPEISLHPLWQSRFLSILSQLFDEVKGCHCILSSHSHLLVSDLPLNASNVIALHKTEKEIHSRIIEYPTYGLSSEDVLLNVFNMPSSRNYALSLRLTDILEKIGREDFSSIDSDTELEFIEGILSYIKHDDPLKSVASLIKEILYERKD